jgi:hypothetical protein
MRRICTVYAWDETIMVLAFDRTATSVPLDVGTGQMDKWPVGNGPAVAGQRIQEALAAVRLDAPLPQARAGLARHVAFAGFGSGTAFRNTARACDVIQNDISTVISPLIMVDGSASAIRSCKRFASLGTVFSVGETVFHSLGPDEDLCPEDCVATDSSALSIGEAVYRFLGLDGYLPDID